MQHQASAGCPVTEIREGHDGALGYTQKFVQESHRVADFLNGAVDDGVIEAAVLEIANAAFVKVALDHGHIVFEAIHDALEVALDTENFNMLFLVQEIEKFAVTAAEVEHLAVFLDEASDEVEVFGVVENRHDLRFGFGRNNLTVEETANSLAEVADFNKESVVTELRVELKACHYFAGIQKCTCNAARFMRREKPVGTQVHVQEFSLYALECVFKGTVFRFEIEAVGCVCNMQLAIGVEAVYEFGTLVAQVAFERKVQVERCAVGDCVVTAFLVLGALEFLFHAHGTEVGNVG